MRQGKIYSDLNFATNSPGFDFPEYTGLPEATYVIASSSRSGSNMLQRALWRSGKAGAPEEYLTPKYIADFSRRWPIKRNDPASLDMTLFVTQLMRYRTSENGIFGIKMHGDHLSFPYLRHINLQKLLLGPRFIWLRRQDKVRQAISYALADHTGIWILDGEWLQDKMPSSEPPRFSAERLDGYMQAIEREEEAWRSYFATHQVEYLEVAYENLVAQYDNTMSKCFRFLSIEPLSSYPPPGIRKQANSLNDAWYQRYMEQRPQSF